MTKEKLLDFLYSEYLEDRELGYSLMKSKKIVISQDDFMIKNREERHVKWYFVKYTASSPRLRLYCTVFIPGQKNVDNYIYD